MSSNNPESQDQDWPIYPGTPGQAGSGAGQQQPVQPEPPHAGPPHADPPARDDAYQAYQSYSWQQSQHPSMSHYRHQPRRPNPQHGLQGKYQWIVIGVIAAVVLTAMARGGVNLWPLLIFGGVIWWILSKRKKG